MRQDNLDRLLSSVATLATEQEHIKNDVTEIKADVKGLTERPAKRWDAVIAAIITGVVKRCDWAAAPWRGVIRNFCCTGDGSL